MKRRIALDTIRKRLPRGFSPPAAFAGFVRMAAGTDPSRTAWFQVVWTDPRDFELKADAARELIPFLRLGDGGVVAFWLAAPRGTAIVHFDSEGERKVVAASFDELVARMARRRSGVPDLDDGEEDLGLPAAGRAVRAVPASLQKAFARWCEAMSALQPPATGNDAERLRRRFYRAARKMIGDGRCRVYSLRDSWWDMDFMARRVGARLRVTYLDYGKWYPVPATYGIEPLVEEMLRLVKHPGRHRFEMTVVRGGLVSVDNDRELVLEP